MEVIYKNDNVVADISGFTIKLFQERFERYMLGQLGEAIAYSGDPHSILFGTDWPICDMVAYQRFVAKLDLTDQERADIMWRNAARVFRLPVEASAPATAD
jgi:predicted TIM-barrel fold metal-dependent hydrolase